MKSIAGARGLYEDLDRNRAIILNRIVSPVTKVSARRTLDFPNQYIE